MDAATRLQELQKKCGYVSHSILTDFMKNRSEDFLSSLLKDLEIPTDARDAMRSVWTQEYERMMKDAPSPYEDPILYRLLHDLFTRVSSQADKILDHERFHFPKKLTYGTLEIGEFSAFVESGIEQEDYLIVVSGGLFGFANLLAKCVGALIVDTEEGGKFTYSLSPKHIDRALAERHMPILRFIDLVMGYVWTGNPHSAEQYNPAGAQLAAISSLIREAFELFVVGHEYSHILLGHMGQKAVLTGQRTQSIPLNNEQADEQIRVIVQNWMDESAADCLSSQLVIASLGERGFDFGASYLGVDIALLTLSLLESLREQLENQTLSYETHPPGEIRRDIVKQMYQDSNPPFEKIVNGIGDSNQRLFDGLWKRCMYVLSEMNQTFQKMGLSNIYHVKNYFFLRRLLYKVGDFMLSKFDEQNAG